MVIPNYEVLSHGWDHTGFGLLLFILVFLVSELMKLGYVFISEYIMDVFAGDHGQLVDVPEGLRRLVRAPLVRRQRIRRSSSYLVVGVQGHVGLGGLRTPLDPSFYQLVYKRMSRSTRPSISFKFLC